MRPELPAFPYRWYTVREVIHGGGWLVRNFLIGVLIFGGVVYAAISIGPSPEVAQGQLQEVQIDQIGYFKNDRADRVFVYCVSRDLPEAQARDHLASVPSTAGRMTLAVVKNCGDVVPNGDVVTLAPSLQAAMQAISMGAWSDWQWRLRVNPAGERTVDAS